MMDFASNALADISNIGMHFAHPLTDYSQHCSCLLCAARDKNQHKPTNIPKQLALTRVPTPSDLDLVKTGSKSIRQLVVVSPADKKNASMRTFCAELVGLYYTIGFELPKIDASVPYHVLVLVLDEELEQDAQHDAIAWFKDVIVRHTRRSVVLCPSKCLDAFVNLETAKITLLAYNNLDLALQALTHAMMVTKRRLMTKDLSKFMPESALALMKTQQPGMCLFL
jgi:hypothetical protein